MGHHPFLIKLAKVVVDEPHRSTEYISILACAAHIPAASTIDFPAAFYCRVAQGQKGAVSVGGLLAADTVP